jgi:hypothetical protein
MKQAFGCVPQNALDIELCLRITNGKPVPTGNVGVNASAKKMADKRTLDRQG